MPDAILNPVAGHWDTKDGEAMAARCLTETRADLTKSFLSDFALANAQYLVSRESFDLIGYQTAAKERIRWLSAHLANMLTAAENLRVAQRAYMAERGNDELGKAVGIAAEVLDAAIAKARHAG